MITVTCATCGKTFQKPAAWAKRVANHYCSRQCNGKVRGQEWAKHAHKGRAAWTDQSRASYQEKMSGANNPAWKGGVTYWRKHGNYPPIKYIRCPDDLLAMARKDNYVMEHRVIMARMVGRPLLRSEVVHHLDHNPQNNLPQNLELWPSNQAHKLAEHGRIAPGAACQLFLTV